MYRLTVVYDEPADTEAFERRYTEEHVPLVKAVPGLSSFQLSHPQGGTPYLVAELFWPSEDAFKASAATAEMAETPHARGRLRHDVHGLHRRRCRSLTDAFVRSRTTRSRVRESALAACLRWHAHYRRDADGVARVAWIDVCLPVGAQREAG